MGVSSHNRKDPCSRAGKANKAAKKIGSRKPAAAKGRQAKGRKRLTGKDHMAVIMAALSAHGGPLEDFKPTPPPAQVRHFLRSATIRQLQGTLVATLAALRSRQGPAKA